MNVEHLIVNINSEQPAQLIAFYKEVIGLAPDFGLTAGAFNVGGATLIIEGHSEVKGPALEPQRVLLNFVVSNALAEEARLMEQGVRFVRTAYKELGVGTFATFLDLDGNYCQLVELSG